MVRFLSLATMSQLVVAVTLLFMLPLQIHAWGHDLVAIWLVGAASAAILNVADLGLRNAGFAALSAGDGYFGSIWSVMRAQILALGLVIAVALVLVHGLKGDPWIGVFLVLLVTASAAENMFYLRGVFMESLGLIVRFESLFLAFAVVRLVLGGVLLLVFKVGPLALSVLWVVSALAVLLIQGRMKGFVDVAPLARNWTFADARRAYDDAKWSASTPLVTWAQMNLPVLALSSFAAATAVSGFVAIRTLFGLVRTMIVQIGRVASVSYVNRMREGEGQRARGVVLLAASLAGWIGAGVGLAVFAENFWLTGRLFDLEGNARDRLFAMALAVSAVLAVHQLFNLSLAREGAFAVVGRANYAYVAAMGVVCLLAVLTSDTLVVAFGLIATDALLLVMSAWLFLRSDVARDGADAVEHGLARSRTLFIAGMAGWIVLLAIGWRLFMHKDAGAPTPELVAVMATMVAAGLIWLSAGAVFWWRARGQIRALFASAKTA